MIVSLEVSCTVQWRVNKARFRFCLLFGLISWTTCISAASWPTQSCCRKKWGCPTRERRFALMIKFYFVQTLSSLNCMLWRNAKRDRVQHSGRRTQSLPYSSHYAEQRGRGGGLVVVPLISFFLQRCGVSYISAAADFGLCRGESEICKRFHTLISECVTS